MEFRPTRLAWLAPLLLGCGASLQQDAGPTADASDGGIAVVDAIASPDGGDPLPTGPWRVFARLGAPSVRAIWGTSDGDIWAAGGYYPNVPGPIHEGTPFPDPVPRIVHYDGTGWRDVPVSGSGIPWRIWGLAPNDIWTTGESIRHFDGVSWREISAQVALSVWGASPDDVWFGLEDRLLRWNGTALAAVSAPPVDGFFSLWGFSATDVWAGGGSGGLIHWDGRAWSIVPTGTTLYVHGLWGARPDDLWGVGNGGNRLHWNGSTIVAAEEGWTSFHAVTGTGPRDVWGVGECCWEGGAPYKAWMSHYDGAGWTNMTIPGFSQLSDVWVSPSGTYYAVADGNAVLSTGPAQARGGALDAAASAACVTASDSLTAKLNGFVDDIQKDGGPCATVRDCKLFVPQVACGDGYRLTGCAAVVSDTEAVRVALDGLRTPECGSIAADTSCRAQIFAGCQTPVAACESGRCTSNAAL